MKVDVYTITYNDIKLLPYFLRHYETFADRIFAWDDGSDDGTRELLDSHPKVTVLEHNLRKLDDFYFVQHLWPQYVKSRGHADWVICAESDEFVYHPNILEKLSELKSQKAKKVNCVGFDMYHPKFPETKGQIYDEIKLGAPDSLLSKTIVIDPDVHVKWAVGRHRCSNEKTVTFGSGIAILHYRLLGYDYYMEKYRKHYRRARVEDLENLELRLMITREEFATNEERGTNVVDGKDYTDYPLV